MDRDTPKFELRFMLIFGQKPQIQARGYERRYALQKLFPNIWSSDLVWLI